LGANLPGESVTQGLPLSLDGLTKPKGNIMEHIITEFYYRSLRGTLKEFDFETAWEYMRPSIKGKLYEHAQMGTVEDYQEIIKDIYGDIIIQDLPGWATIKNDYVYFVEEDAVKAIISAQYKCLKETFEGTLDDLIDMLHKMDSVLSLEENTILFDEVIHAQHTTGDIFEDTDTDTCKEEAEKMFSEHESLV